MKVQQLLPKCLNGVSVPQVIAAGHVDKRHGGSLRPFVQSRATTRGSYENSETSSQSPSTCHLSKPQRISKLKNPQVFACPSCAAQN